MGILEVYCHFLKTNLIWDHETWFAGTLWVLSGVFEELPPRAKFMGRFWPQIWDQNKSMCRFSFIFLKGFDWSHTKLDL